MPPLPPCPRKRFPGDIMLRFRRDPLGFLTHLQRQHGDVVTFKSAMQRYFILFHPDQVKDVLVTHGDQFLKGPALQRSKETLGEGLLTSEGDFHRKQRKLMQPAFHATFVKRYAGDMTACLQEFQSRLKNGQAIDLHKEMMRLTLAIAGRTLFGTSLERETEEISAAMETTIGMFRRAVVPWGSLLGKLPLKSNRDFKTARARLHQTIERMINDRRANTAHQGGDLLSILLAARDDETTTGMDNRQLFDECFTLLSAGHETTANALTFTLWLLARHPLVLEKLREELRLSADQPPEKLPYLKAVIAESLRLYPPAWSLGRQAKVDIPAGDYVLTKRSTVLLCQWVTHRDPRWWTSPEAFQPDRWLGEPTHPRYAYFPFGGGQRGCIGDSFAMLELGVLLAGLVPAFRFQPLTDHLALTPTITLRPRDGVPAIVHR